MRIRSRSDIRVELGRIEMNGLNVGPTAPAVDENVCFNPER
jgi:hypothetical protein